MVTVRPASPADAEAVVRIHMRSWQRAYGGIMPDDVLGAIEDQIPGRVSRLRERLTAPEPRPFQTLVAAAPATVGFTTFGPYRVNQGSDDTLDPAVGEVVLIYIDPDHQGRGTGRILLDAAVAALRARDVGEIRLWVLEDNTPARTFYERYGFVADGERHFFRVTRPNGTSVDLPEVRYALPGNRSAAAGVG